MLFVFLIVVIHVLGGAETSSYFNPRERDMLVSCKDLFWVVYQAPGNWLEMSVVQFAHLARAALLLHDGACTRGVPA
jgi:hypothetical protein